MADPIPRPWIVNPEFAALARTHAEGHCLEHRCENPPCEQHLEQATADLGERWHRQEGHRA